MSAAHIRTLLREIPHAEETEWDDKLVYWTGSKLIGGRMFAMLRLTPESHDDRPSPPLLSFSAGPDRFPELLEREYIRPAPYLARAHWVSLDRWSAIPLPELRQLLQNAYALTFAKLPKHTQATLALSPSAYRKAVAAKRLDAHSTRDPSRHLPVRTARHRSKPS